MTCSLTGWSKPLGLLALLALAACGRDPRAGQYVGDIITATDFEDLAGWGADVQALSREHAHSGRFATFAGPAREFSLTYHLPLREASVHTIKAVEVEGWVYVPSDKAAASLVVQVFRPPGSADASPLYNEPLHLLGEVHEYGKWQPVHHVFALPPDLPGDADLRLYLWRDSSPETVYLDDLTMKARE